MVLHLLALLVPLDWTSCRCFLTDSNFAMSSPVETFVLKFVLTEDKLHVRTNLRTQTGSTLFNVKILLSCSEPPGRIQTSRSNKHQQYHQVLFWSGELREEQSFCRSVYILFKWRVLIIKSQLHQVAPPGGSVVLSTCGVKSSVCVCVCVCVCDNWVMFWWTLQLILVHQADKLFTLILSLCVSSCSLF